MKLSESTDLSNPHVLLAKEQAKADKYKQQAYAARTLLFDFMYPDYNPTGDETFKQEFMNCKELLNKYIKKHDALLMRCQKQTLELNKLRALLMKDVIKEGEQA